MKPYRYKFEVGKTLPADQWRRPGKAEWANLLEVEMTSDRALLLAEELIRIARIQPGETVRLSFSGELVEDDD